MGEKNFGKIDSIRSSMLNVVHNLGRVVRGEAVLVPVRRGQYADRVDRLLRADFEWHNAEKIVSEALDLAPLTSGDGANAEAHYGLPDSTLWHNRWRASEPAQAAQISPSPNA